MLEHQYHYMKQTLQLGLRQQLTMTPQLQQAIRLLALSSLELETAVQDLLDSNYMLERAEEGDEGAPSDQLGRNGEEPSASPAEPPLETTVEPVDIPKELAVDTAWEDIYDGPTAHGAPDPSTTEFESRQTRVETLRDHLIDQLELIEFNPVDRLIAEVLIDGIDDDGYLSIALDEVVELLFDEDHEDLRDVGLPEIEAVLKQIQNFEPAGIAARNLQECLLLQLRQQPELHILQPLALRLVRDYFHHLENRDYARLQRQLDVDEAGLNDLLGVIQGLHPKPGRFVADKAPEYVIPDVIVTKVNGQWIVELNPDAVPKLRVNSLYASYVRPGDKSNDNESLKKHLTEAQWFIKSLSQRSDTLRKVATCIVERQHAFLDEGEVAMKPMVLHDVANEVSMHESTISRVTTQKYMHTPRGLFELKYFFSSQVATDNGEGASSTAIKARIRKLIDEETPRKPLSDNKLAAALSAEGFNVARRTVAKYRESINIPSSSERKRLS